MVARFKVDAPNGVFGLYTVPTAGSTDDSPLTDPFNHLDRIIYHPFLRYPGVVGTLSGTLSLPAASSSFLTTERRTHTLGAHGLGGSVRPMIIGRFTNLAASHVPWAGTVCVQCPLVTYGFIGPPVTSASLRTLQVSRWLSLGVSGANVVAHEMMRGNTTLGPAGLSLNYTVLILNRDLIASLPSSGPTRFRIDGTALKFESAKGTVSSEDSFIKKNAGGFVISGGRTTNVRYNDTVGGSVVRETTFEHNLSVYSVSVPTLARTNLPTSAPASGVTPRVETVST